VSNLRRAEGNLSVLSYIHIFNTPNREADEIDVAAVYHQLVDVYHSSESENEVDSDVVPSTSTGPTTSAAAARQRVSSTRR